LRLDAGSVAHRRQSDSLRYLHTARKLGGAPADVANLWPEPWAGDANAYMKDAVENYLNREACRGAISLASAERMIAPDWLKRARPGALAPPLAA
jgi:hypothetical protein